MVRGISIESYDLKKWFDEDGVILSIYAWGTVGWTLTLFSLGLLVFGIVIFVYGSTRFPDTLTVTIAFELIGLLSYISGVMMLKRAKTLSDKYWSDLREVIPELDPEIEGSWRDEYYHVLIFIPLFNAEALGVLFPSKTDLYTAVEKEVGETTEVLEDLILESRITSDSTANPAFSHLNNAKLIMEKKGVGSDTLSFGEVRELKHAAREAQKARNLAEQQAELLDETEPIGEIVNSNLPDGPKKKASDKFETAHERIAQGQYEEARELANEAEEIAKSAVDYLIDEGNAFANQASKCHEQDEYADAIDRWEEALDAYNEALSLAPEMDKEDRVPAIRESIADAERNRNRSRMYDIVREGQNQIEDAEQALGEEEYEQAIKAYENARNIHTRAHEIADEHGFEEESRLADSLASIEERLQASRVRQIEAALDEANALLDDDEHAAEERFEALIDGIDDTAIDDEALVESLRRRAQQGHLQAQIEQGWSKIDHARAQFENRDYYGAREAFEESTEYLEQVLSQASVYGFGDKKEEISRLVQLCSENAEQARQALYETGPDTPQLKSLDEIEAADIPPRARNSQRDQLLSRAQNEGYQTQEYEFDLGVFIREESSDKIGHSLPDHERLNLIGAGGNAKVWHVRLEETGDEAALKIPKWEGTLSKDVVERFLREAETWSRIDDHDNIVSVYDWGFAARPWLLIEYMEGGDLRPYVGSIPLDKALDVLISVADALQYARGVDHLDIKPENILLDSGGTAKLADWGLAKVAFRNDDTDTRMGISPPYAAPEQVDHTLGDRDHLTDIYQLGVTGYELLTGQLPFDPEAPESLEQRILSGDPRPPTELNPGIPSEVGRVILQATAVDRSDRYETAVQFRNTLKESQKAITSSE